MLIAFLKAGVNNLANPIQATASRPNTNANALLGVFLTFARAWKPEDQWPYEKFHI